MFQVKSFGSKGSVHCMEIVGLLEGPQEGSIFINNCQNFLYILQKILIKLVIYTCNKQVDRMKIRPQKRNN